MADDFVAATDRLIHDLGVTNAEVEPIKQGLLWLGGISVNDHTGDGFALAAAGVELRVQRMRSDLEASLSGTWRGRLALRLSRWYARRRHAR